MSPLADALDDELGFGAGNEDVWRDLEVQSPELALTSDEGYRLARGAPLDERGEAPVDVGRHRIAPIGQEARPVPAERMPSQHLGVEPCVLGREARAHERLPRVSDPLVYGCHRSAVVSAFRRTVPVRLKPDTTTFSILVRCL